MSEYVTLDHFGASYRHYHVYRIQNTALDHQTHYHNYYQICFVTCGEIQHCQGNSVITLGPGDAFIVPPGFPHSLHFINNHSEMYSLSFEENLFHEGFPLSTAHQFLSGLHGDTVLPNDYGVRLRVQLDDDQQQNLHALMDCLLREQARSDSMEISAVPSIITSIVYVLAQSYYRQPQNVPQLNELLNYSSTLSQCIHYIDEHYREPLTLESLAKQFGLSRSAFCTVFPQFAGLPLRRYISQKRIQEAQRLIRSVPDLSLNQVAHSVGYEDFSTFYRNFLRISGVSPSRYRELCSSNA